MSTKKKTQAKKQSGRHNRKVNITTVELYNVSLNKDDILLVEANQQFNFADGFSAEMLREAGHELLSYTISDRKIEKSIGKLSSKNFGPIRVTESRVYRIFCGTVNVTKDSDFDDVDTHMRKAYRHIIKGYGLKDSEAGFTADALFISKLTTTRDGNVFTWERKEMRTVEGKSSVKLICTMMNNILLSKLKAVQKRNITTLVGLKMMERGYCRVNISESRNVLCSGHSL